ncbi:MAG: oligosaccharide flippase family protein [Bacteroidales bacterium]|nr:oligosaccharide flippase family protein [Bacteroidales bacterium]
MVKSGKNKLYKDFAWYFSGNIATIIIAIIKSPIFTRHYTPEEYGNYTIVTVTFSILSIILFTSASSCIWRFYNQYKIKNRLDLLYGMLLLFYGASIIVLATISGLWHIFSVNETYQYLIFLSFIQFVSNEIILVFMIIFKLERKAGIYTILNSARTILTFLVLLFLAFVCDMSIESLIVSAIFINLAVLLILLVVARKKIIFSFGFNKHEISEMFSFGLMSILFKLGFTLLVSSDRYFIKFFDNINNVGVYNQVYNLGQISLDSLIIVFFSSVSPILNEHLTISIARCNKLIRKYIKIYIQYFTPVLVYLVLYSETIAKILLGPEFQTGSSILPYIFISSYLYGITNFYELKLKFENRLNLLLWGIIASLVVNCVLNIIFIPTFGYKAAAFTTLIGFALLFMLYQTRNSFNYLKQKRNSYHLLFIAFVLLIQVIIHFSLKSFIRCEQNIFYEVIEGIIFSIVFLYSIYRFNKKHIAAA